MTGRLLRTVAAVLWLLALVFAIVLALIVVPIYQALRTAVHRAFPPGESVMDRITIGLVWMAILLWIAATITIGCHSEKFRW